MNSRISSRFLPIPRVPRVRVDLKPGPDAGCRFVSVLALLLLSVVGTPLLAQPGAPFSPQSPQPDPLMSLLLSQPRIALGAPVHATASFDPPVVRLGEWSVYRVTFNALEQSIAWPEMLTASPTLEMRPGARGQILQILGPTMEPRTTFNYLVRASEKGSFVVPEFGVKVDERQVTVPSARLSVVSSPPPTVPPAQRLKVEVAETNLYVGQPVRVRVILPGSSSGMLQSLTQVQLTGQGFLVDQTAVRQRVEPMPNARPTVPAFIYETLLTPIEPGRLSFFAQGFTIGNRYSAPVVVNGTVTMPGAQPLYTLLDSDRVELAARPLPRTGELPGFTGAVGRFLLDPPRLATNATRVGDLLKLAVTVRSDNFSTRLVPPPPPRAREWQVFAATIEPGPAQAIPVPPPPAPFAGQAAVTFNYTLIPLTDKAHATPEIPFSYFDPERGRYVNLSIPSVPIKVRPGAVPGEWQVLQQPDAPATEAEDEPVLSGLATAPGLAASSLVPLQQHSWFFLVQVAPAIAFGALWGWDRRRRFLEQHPDIVLRRRARRALRRARSNLRRAASASDAPRFATAAVHAMRIACGPHFPAEPRALVGRDVLHVLQQAEQDLPRHAEVVRRLFSATDAVEFGQASADGKELLDLQREIDEILLRLEAQLCA